MPLDEETLVRRLQAIIYAVKRRQTDRALALCFGALVSVGTYLYVEWKELRWASCAAYILAIVCLLWLAWRLWKVAAPPSEPAEKPAPSAIKGLLPWGITDGELFASLGRRAELQFLLDRAQNDQIPITVVRGESGAGKTSLLQAGLQFTLKKENCVYWEARSSNAPGELLHAIRNQFPEIGSLDALPAASKSRWVLILDQFEQLRAGSPEYFPVFQLLERIVKEPRPHRLSPVVSFRREYQADWSDFELAHEFRAEQVAVNLMTRPVARDVTATLATKAGFSLEEKLVDNFLANIAQEQSGRVSPLDISIGLESLAKFAEQQGVDRITMDDYQLAGGAEGLLLAFVQQKLDEVPESIRPRLLQGIVLSLVDLATDHRVAEGNTAVAIASKASLPVEALKPWLDRLTHPRVRLLESVGTDRYRLPHERLILIMRRLTGTSLASLDRIRLIFEGEYARWSRTNSSRNLLRGRELAEVLRYREQLLPGESAGTKTEYLNACLGRRSFLRRSLAGAVIVAGAGAYEGYILFQENRQREHLKSWGLPPELFSMQNHLDALAIKETINDFGWFQSPRLREFEVKFVGSTLLGLRQLKTLTTLTLDLHNSQITSLAGLEALKALTTLTLDLGYLEITSLAELATLRTLTTLTLHLSGSGITSLAELEGLKALTTLTLHLSGSEITSLAALEELKALTTLTLHLSGSRITSLAELKGLKALTALKLDLGYSEITSLAGLATLQTLTTLTLDLNHSEITSLAELATLQTLTTLTLKSLYSSKIISLAELATLQTLTTLTLDLGNSKITSLAELQGLKALTTLTLHFGISKITSLVELQGLKALTTLTLDLENSKITSLAELATLQTLTTLTLDLKNSKITSLAGLEGLKALTTLTLDLTNSQITSLAGLEGLKALTTLTLDLTNSQITSLAPLEQLTGLAMAQVWVPLSLIGNLNIRAKQLLVGCRL
jgi:hypothetical protein